MMNDSILSCRNLSKNFGYHSALSGVNMDIPRGRIIGLLGPNGSGKTTFMKLANGLLVRRRARLSSGDTIRDRRRRRLSRFCRRRNIFRII